MKGRRWFLPEVPDVLGSLAEQMRLTIEGVDRYAAWAAGGSVAASDLREIQQRGDAAKRRQFSALRDAFVTPIEPEDVFALSRGIGSILDAAGALVAEAEALDTAPNPRISEMARILVRAVRELERAIHLLGSSPDDAVAVADAAIETAREVDRVYYEAMAGTLELEPRSDRISLRELYRRSARIGELVVDVAERVVYATVKES